MEPHDPATATGAMRIIASLEQAAWALAAFIALATSGALADDSIAIASPEDEAAARVLQAAGLATATDGGFAPSSGMVELSAAVSVEQRLPMLTSTLRQVATAAGILPRRDASGWATNDDETLVAQGRGSSTSGRMLAHVAVQRLDGLAERFHSGGEFLDVGTGVGEIGAAFAEALPTSRVVGLDVLPRAVDLARRTIAERHLQGRFEVRLQGVESLDDQARFDLAWLPAPFIPPGVFPGAVERIRNALRPGAWLVVAAGRLVGDDLAVAVTRWQTLRAGGTALTEHDCRTVIDAAGLVDFCALPTTLGAPALYVARRPMT